MPPVSSIKNPVKMLLRYAIFLNETLNRPSKRCSKFAHLDD